MITDTVRKRLGSMGELAGISLFKVVYSFSWLCWLVVFCLFVFVSLTQCRVI